MNFPNYFADCESDYKNAKFVIFGVPYDKTSSFRRGAAKAPDEIRNSSWNFETFDLRTGHDISDVKIHDYGNLDVKSLSTDKMINSVNKFTSQLLKDKKIPVAIGGEHSITSGIIKAFPKDIAVLSFDAHMDFRDEYENDKYNHACVIRRVSDYVSVENIAVVGVRSAEKEEYEKAKELGLFFIDSFSFEKIGVEQVIKKLESQFKNKSIYVTLDIDVIDTSYAPGTSTPEPFGLKPFDVLSIIEHFSSQMIGFDVVEVCPPYDNGETSLLAGKIIRSLINHL